MEGGDRERERERKQLTWLAWGLGKLLGWGLYPPPPPPPCPDCWLLGLLLMSFRSRWNPLMAMYFSTSVILSSSLSRSNDSCLNGSCRNQRLRKLILMVHVILFRGMVNLALSHYCEISTLVSSCPCLEHISISSGSKKYSIACAERSLGGGSWACWGG